MELREKTPMSIDAAPISSVRPLELPAHPRRGDAKVPQDDAPRAVNHPIYGEAAAIRALYQNAFLDQGQDDDLPKPKKRQRGRLARFLEVLRYPSRGLSAADAL